MNAVDGFHRHIIAVATRKLERALTAPEAASVRRRRGLLALEMISDTVEAADPEEIIRYLNLEKAT